MKKLLLILIVACAVGGTAWWWFHRGVANGELVLYGNLDLRQVDLAFNNNERIASVSVQEGDHVETGQLLATLDTGRLEPIYQQAEAASAAQQQVVLRLKNGSRPEEIAQARANVAAAQADLANARRQFNRVQTLFDAAGPKAVSQQDLDNAKAVLDVAEAHAQLNQKTLDLAVLGPRAEDIAQAEAQLRSAQAQAALLKQQLADARLYAPADAVVRTRLLEVGDMASPQRAVYTLALVNPKWVRAYVTEPDLGKVHPGMKAQISVDSFPSRTFSGWIGFISPAAEFTPKSVETDELRTSLVYEVRVFVTDPKDELRLGMPATVRLTTAAPASPTTNATQPSQP
jgi:HlyD family secretion protein